MGILHYFILGNYLHFRQILYHPKKCCALPQDLETLKKKTLVSHSESREISGYCTQHLLICGTETRI